MTGDINDNCGDYDDIINNFCDEIEDDENSENSNKMMKYLQEKHIKTVRFDDNMNQYNNKTYFEPTCLGYTEKQLFKQCHGSHNVKTLVKTIRICLFSIMP